MARSLKARHLEQATENKMTPEQERIEKEIAMQQPKYQRMNLINVFKGKLRERKYLVEQIVNPTMLDEACEFKQVVPVYKVLNTIDKVEFDLEQIRDRLRTMLNMTDEEIENIENGVIKH